MVQTDVSSDKVKGFLSSELNAEDMIYRRSAF
jgi:hypothetical protein